MTCRECGILCTFTAAAFFFAPSKPRSFGGSWRENKITAEKKKNKILKIIKINKPNASATEGFVPFGKGKKNLDLGWIFGVFRAGNY